MAGAGAGSEAERKAVADVTSAWEYMVANRAKIKSIKDQVKANEIALDGVQKEKRSATGRFWMCWMLIRNCLTQMLRKLKPAATIMFPA